MFLRLLLKMNSMCEQRGISMVTVDLNCDLGEGFGDDIIPYITSANIACGFHAGDPDIMRRTVRACIKHNVAIGAHPGYNDKDNFGRININLSFEETVNLVLYQIGALKAITEAEGGCLRHVKVHGALYNLAVNHELAAAAVVEAITLSGSGLMLFAPPGSAMERIGSQKGLKVIAEVFADRNYNHDLSLVSRQEVHALVSSPDDAAARAVEMVIQNRVCTIQGNYVPLKPRTICLHGDSPQAFKMASMIRIALLDSGITIAAPAPESR